MRLFSKVLLGFFVAVIDGTLIGATLGSFVAWLLSLLGWTTSLSSLMVHATAISVCIFIPVVWALFLNGVELFVLARRDRRWLMGLPRDQSVAVDDSDFARRARAFERACGGFMRGLVVGAFFFLCVVCLACGWILEAGHDPPRFLLASPHPNDIIGDRVGGQFLFGLGWIVASLMSGFLFALVYLTWPDLFPSPSERGTDMPETGIVSMQPGLVDSSAG